MNILRRSTYARVPLMLLLLAVAGTTSAREVSRQGPNGDGGACPKVAETGDPEPPAATKRAEPAIQGKAKTAPIVRGGSENATRPRWHSFLPGMFR